MKRSEIVLSLCFPIFLVFSSKSSAAGENVHYLGVGMLDSVPGFFGEPGALYPGTYFLPSASNNIVIVNFSTGIEPGYVYGGLSHPATTPGNATVSNNVVLVENGSLVSGSMSTVFGGRSQNNLVENNQVIWNSTGSVSSIYGGMTYSSSENANSNTVIINDGTIGGYSVSTVRGGSAPSFFSGDASYNKVIINGGTIKAHVVGGYSSSSSANYNEVIINAGTLLPADGFYTSIAIAGGYSFDGEASHNKIIISGGEIGGYVYAGNASIVKNNTITIKDGPNLTNARLFGTTNNSFNVWSKAGNTLTIDGFHGKIHSIGNFQYYDFYLPTSLGVGDSLLQITNNVDMRETIISIQMDNNSPSYIPGDSIYLVSVSSGTLNTNDINSGSTITANTTFVTYEWALDQPSGEQKLRATLLGAKSSSESKSFLQPPAGSLAFLSQSSDLISAGLFQALKVSEKTPSAWVGIAAFNGGSSRYESGSHTDISGGHLLAGLGRHISVGTGGGLIGIFAETGIGNYRGKNDTDVASMTSKGDLRYSGGGILVRYDIDRLYLDAAIRMGSTRVEYRSNDIPGYNVVNYNANTPYYGFQAGIGYDAKINDRSGLELYGRYYWVHQKEKDIAVLNHRVHLADANSHRIKAGAKYYHAVRTKITPYIGAGYEYEFDGRLNGTINAIEIPHLSLKGGSGFGEAGLQILPLSAHRNLLLDLNLTGHAGRRTGVVGGLKVKYEF